MAECRTLHALELKRRQLAYAVARYEQLLAKARADLANVTAAIPVFQEPDDGPQAPAYGDLRRVYRPRELVTLCKVAITDHGPLDTRQLAIFALEAKGLDGSDTVLTRAVADRIIHAMRMQHRRGKMVVADKRGGVCLWALPSRS
jgi:hypothetical protein